MINCDNDLIVCIDKPNKKPSEKTVNKLYEKMFNTIIEKIKTNKELSKEDFDFIESLPCEKKMLIIREYNKKHKENAQILETIRNTGLR
jgi:predicted patatin/cPLA2 family phospholipase